MVTGILFLILKKESFPQNGFIISVPGLICTDKTYYQKI